MGTFGGEYKIVLELNTNTIIVCNFNTLRKATVVSNQFINTFVNCCYVN